MWKLGSVRQYVAFSFVLHCRKLKPIVVAWPWGLLFFYDVLFFTVLNRVISLSLSFTLGFLTWAHCQGVWGQKMGERQGKEWGSEGGMGGTGVRRGVMECGGLERQANWNQVWCIERGSSEFFGFREIKKTIHLKTEKLEKSSWLCCILRVLSTTLWFVWSEVRVVSCGKSFQKD